MRRRFGVLWLLIFWQTYYWTFSLGGKTVVGKLEWEEIASGNILVLARPFTAWSPITFCRRVVVSLDRKKQGA